jgi:uncharacterized protein HemX
MPDNDNTSSSREPDPTQPVATGPPRVTQTAPAPGPPSFPPPAIPAVPAKTGGGGGIPTPVFIGVAVVAVAALAFGIFSFLGKSSEADKKKDAESELSDTRQELALANDEIAAANDEVAELEDFNAQLSEDLGLTEDFAAALDQVLGSGVTAADSLYECADTAYTFILNFLDSGNPDVGQAEAVDDRCANAQTNYDTFYAALDELAGL